VCDDPSLPLVEAIILIDAGDPAAARQVLQDALRRNEEFAGPCQAETYEAAALSQRVAAASTASRCSVRLTTLASAPSMRR